MKQKRAELAAQGVFIAITGRFVPITGRIHESPFLRNAGVHCSKSADKLVSVMR